MENKNSVLLGGAGLAAFSLALRYYNSKESKFISDLSKVGQKSAKSGISDGKGFDEYDVIIIGGGTAGCVLASRLSEDPNIKVLLLEAGGSGRALLFTRIPSAYSLLFHSKHVHQFYTTMQMSAGGKARFWPRAKMLGGCSAINAQMAQYGSPSDFNEWAQIMKDDSWSWKEFGPYFQKFENVVHDPRYPKLDLNLRGNKGPVQVGFFNSTTKASDDFVKTCPKIGIPFTPDFNTVMGTKGVSRIMTYVDKKNERVTTETAYLTPDVLARPNLKVAIHAQVTKIIFETVAGEKRAVGVEFASYKNGPLYRARARKEVIVAGGAVHSPQILMLSGVGPAAHLKAHGISVFHDLPGVGEHLTDHPVVDLRFKDKAGLSANFLKPTTPYQVAQAAKAGIQYLTSGTGPYASNLGESACFFRSDDPTIFPKDQYPEAIEDSTSGGDGPDIEILTTPVAYREHNIIVLPKLHTFAMHVVLLRPTSYGTVKLKSTDPWDAPVMDPNYCSTQHDVDVLVRGLKAGLKISQTQPLAALLDETDTHAELDHSLHLKSDAELAQVVRERVETLYHPACSCRMASLEDGGVVDTKFRLYGIKGLRVCDASTFPVIVSGHTAAAVIAGAEKLADIIKAEYHSKSA